MKTFLQLTKKKVIICFILLYCLPNVSFTQPTDNVVVYYPFCGNAKDVTGKGMDCSVSGATLITDRLGNTNSAYFFDGTNDLINMPTNLPFNNQSFCISFWMKSSGIHSTPETGQTLIDFRGQYQIAVSYYQSNDATPNSVSFYTYSSPNSNSIYSPANSILVNNWYHIVGNYGDGIMELYVNGTLVNSKASTPPNSVCCYNNTIGKDYNTDLNRCWVYGALDEILVYKRKLLPEEIKAIYERGLKSNVITEIFAPIKFDYDNSGNRTDRYTVVLKSAAQFIQRDSIHNIEKNPGTFEDNLGDKTIIIYPNPTRGQITVEIKGIDEFSNTSLSLYDLYGKILFTMQPLSNHVPIDLSNYSVGTYIMKIALGDKISEWKIIKE